MHKNEKLLLFSSCIFILPQCLSFHSVHSSSALLSYHFFPFFISFLVHSLPSQCAFLVCLYLNFIILISLWLYPMSFPPEVCKSPPSLSLSLCSSHRINPHLPPPLRLLHLTASSYSHIFPWSLPHFILLVFSLFPPSLLYYSTFLPFLVMI